MDLPELEHGPMTNIYNICADGKWKKKKRNLIIYWWNGWAINIYIKNIITSILLSLTRLNYPPDMQFPSMASNGLYVSSYIHVQIDPHLKPANQPAMSSLAKIQLKNFFNQLYIPITISILNWRDMRNRPGHIKSQKIWTQIPKR